MIEWILIGLLFFAFMPFEENNLEDDLKAKYKIVIEDSIFTNDNKEVRES